MGRKREVVIKWISRQFNCYCSEWEHNKSQDVSLSTLFFLLLLLYTVHGTGLDDWNSPSRSLHLGAAQCPTSKDLESLWKVVDFPGTSCLNTDFTSSSTRLDQNFEMSVNQLFSKPIVELSQRTTVVSKCVFNCDVNPISYIWGTRVSQKRNKHLILHWRIRKWIYFNLLVFIASLEKVL